jgi:hypothetical protein
MITDATAPETQSMQPTEPLDLLRQLLSDIDSEAAVIDRSKEQIHMGKFIRGREFVEPTHVVMDVDGEIVGWGLSEGEAIADAIKRDHEHLARQVDRYRTAVRAYTSARSALENL